MALGASSFLDYNGYFDTGYSTGTMPTGTRQASATFNVALVLSRAASDQQVQSLLNANWASRQEQLAAYNANGSLWQTFGANQSQFNAVVQAVNNLGIKTVDQIAPQNGYVSDAASRTVWVQVNADQFKQLFGTTLLQQTNGSNGNLYWQGNLGLSSLGVAAPFVQGLWFDTSAFQQQVLPTTGAAQANLPLGSQGLGNGAGATANNPQAVAAYYNFPLNGASAKLNVPTAPIGLMEPGLGDQLLDANGNVLPPGSYQTNLNQNYRTQIGLSGNGVVAGIEPGGTPGGDTGEQALDVGVATAVNPNSALVMYAGSGSAGGAQSDPFTPYQSAFYQANPLSVVSSSFRFGTNAPSPNSPFYWAAQQLFIDGALANISVFNSSGDGGSGYEVANGLDNSGNGRNSAYSVVVGGTSLSTVAYAQNDPTLMGQLAQFPINYVAQALAGDKATLWQLIRGGLTQMPTSGSSDWFAEAVWNRYSVVQDPFNPAKLTISPGYNQNQASNGGVDFTQPEPWYQSAILPFNPPTTSDGSNRTGRGVPDVSALSSGDMYYNVPNSTLTGLTGNGGTSAATPLWASLTVQMNTVLRDQGIPYNLGYMNDLLYIADVIAPASFNDVTLGNNDSSYLVGGSPYQTATSKADSTREPVTPTGFGYNATNGYDLASGLGSPNGVVLTETLSAITHQQLYYSNIPNMLSADGTKSTVRQSLLIQGMSDSTMSVNVKAGASTRSFSSRTSTYGWTPRLAGQALQGDFDDDLVQLFDKDSQGTLAQVTMGAGDDLSVTLNGSAASAFSLAMTDPFGFADFQTSGGTLRIARPVAVAEMAQNTHQAVARIRQNATDSLSVMFYRVDDLAGSIGTLQPGNPGYASFAAARAYQLTSDTPNLLSTGNTTMSGPGDGQYTEAYLQGVNAGDLIAMELFNNTHNTQFWAFAQANELVNGQNFGHLWNYAANVWGWEDTLGGGDRDYNDLVIGFDFTAAAGHGILK